MRTVRVAAASLLAALTLGVALAGCGGGPPPPVIDERGAGADAGDQPTAPGPVVTFDGRVTGQAGEYGDPVPVDAGSAEMVVPRLVVLTVERQGGGTVEVELVREYVAPDQATAGPVALELPDTLLTFTVRQREDGRFECTFAPCIQEAG